MSEPITIPSDVDREDRILGPLTARQVAILAVTALVLYAGWWVSRGFLPVAVYLVAALPAAAVVLVLITVRRDGMSLDRLALAGLRHRLRPTRRVAANDAPLPPPEWISQAVHSTAGQPPTAALQMPAHGVDEAGVLDLGTDGMAMVAACSTVPFALRTAGEQRGLVAAFGRYLHSLTGPVQILVRALPLDLAGQISELRERADALPHPALRAAAADHADYLEGLSNETELLRRQVLLVAREPHHTPAPDSTGTGIARLWPGRRGSSESHTPEGVRHAAASRLARRLGEANDLLGPAGITVTPLHARQARAVLASATHPDRPLPASSEIAGADEVITSTPDWQEHD